MALCFFGLIHSWVEIRSLASAGTKCVMGISGKMIENGIKDGKYYGEVTQLTSLVKSLIWPMRKQCCRSHCYIELYGT